MQSHLHPTTRTTEQTAKMTGSLNTTIKPCGQENIGANKKLIYNRLVNIVHYRANRATIAITLGVYREIEHGFLRKFLDPLPFGPLYYLGRYERLTTMIAVYIREIIYDLFI